MCAINLDALLAEAEQKQRWSLALRYHYLKVLRRLVDEGLIEWRPRNTDQDYLAQLQDPSLRAVFSELSSTFKWEWYGDAPVVERRYLFLKKAFEAFHQQHAPGSPSLPHRTTNATPKASATEATPSPEAPARKA